MPTQCTGVWAAPSAGVVHVAVGVTPMHQNTAMARKLLALGESPTVSSFF